MENICSPFLVKNHIQKIVVNLTAEGENSTLSSQSELPYFPIFMKSYFRLKISVFSLYEPICEMFTSLKNFLRFSV